MTREERIVLTTLYNMCSGHFRTNRFDILECFEPSKRRVVLAALTSLKLKDIVYINDNPGDWNHYINWDIFKDEMIDQELMEVGL